MAKKTDATLMITPDHEKQIERLLREHFNDLESGLSWLATNFDAQRPRDLLTAQRAVQVLRALEDVRQRKRCMRTDTKAGRVAVAVANLLRLNFSHIDRGALVLPDSKLVFFGNGAYAQQKECRMEVYMLRKVLMVSGLAATELGFGIDDVSEDTGLEPAGMTWAMILVHDTKPFTVDDLEYMTSFAWTAFSDYWEMEGRRKNGAAVDPADRQAMIIAQHYPEVFTIDAHGEPMPATEVA